MRTLSTVLLACLLIFFFERPSQAQWIQTNGPYGGNVTCFAVSGSNLFAGTSGAGIFRSTNNGTNWTATNEGITDKNIQSLACSGSDILACTVEKVFHSTDDGIHWTQLEFNTFGTAGQLFRVGFSGTNLLVSGELGVFFSTEDGINWMASDLAYSASSFATLGAKLFASTAAGVFVSPNNGASWTSTSYTNSNAHILTVSETKIYMGTSGANGVFVSSDTGTTWTQIDVEQLSGLESLAILDTNIFAGALYSGVSLYTDGGTWTPVNSGLTNTTITSLAVIGMNLFAGTTGGGVFRSSDYGTTWNMVNDGLLNSYVNSLTFSPDASTNLFAGTSSGGVFLSTDDGDNWQEVNSGLTNFDVRSFATIGTKLFAGTYGSGVFLSTNQGTSWIAVNTGLTNKYVRSFVVSGTDLFAGTGSNTSGYVFLSTDDGANWTEVSTGLPNTSIYSLAVKESTIFAGTGGYAHGYGVYISTDQGGNWSTANSGLPSDKRVNVFVAKEATIFAGTDVGAYLSTDNGGSWTASGLLHRVYALAVDSANLFAGTKIPSGEKGVSLSTDNGTTWTEVNLGLTDLGIRFLIVHGSYLYAGTTTGGVYRRTLSEFFIQTITASAGPYGTIKASGSVTVENGGNLKFTIEPNDGYYVDSLIVDDVKTDSTTSYTFLNVTGNHTIRATFAKCLSTQDINVNSKWNLVSVPSNVTDYSVRNLFPSALTLAYAYMDGYYEESRLINGAGYWLKFNGSQSIQITGCDLSAVSIDVMPGWNLIGSIGVPVVTNSITSYPQRMITSRFFGYSDGYFVSDTIQPGSGYWVKVNEGGILFLNAFVNATNAANLIKIVPSGDQPPEAPTDSETVNMIPLTYSLSQNYPNPFNPSTKLSFVVVHSSFVSLKVYDVLGKEVATLVKENKPAGKYEVKFDGCSDEGQNLPSGIYFYRLTTGTTAETKKLVLIR
ncbi:MAG: T9SS type A sorting domain-containing protein [Ignavibacteriales bacterium]|nr:T9SS type A sorting domain-containing protein [Ignavibacteriales bacterium]